MDLKATLGRNTAWRESAGKSDVDLEWHAGEYISRTMAWAKLWGARLFDNVLPVDLLLKIYDPFFSDHDVNHAFRVTQNGDVGLLLDPEIRSLRRRQDKIDAAFALGAAKPLHDCLQVDSTGDKRAGHDQIGGMFFVPAVMRLGNLTGKTNYTERQIALAAYCVTDHELEREHLTIDDFKDPQKIIAKWEAKLGKKLTEIFPSLGELAEQLAVFGEDLFYPKLDFSDITPQYAELVRRQLTAADVRDQVTPPSWAALRAIKAIPGRQYLILSTSPDDFRRFIDKIVKGHQPQSKEFSDDTFRAAYETVRSFEVSDLPAYAKAWLKYSQLRRGQYHVRFAEDMVLIGQGDDLKKTALFTKSAEVARGLENELWRESGRSTEELRGKLMDLSENPAQLVALCQDEEIIKFANLQLQSIGNFVLRQFALQTAHLRHKYELMSQQRGFNPATFVSRVESMMEYAEEKCALHAAMIPREILELKMKKLVVTYSDF